MTIHIVGAGMAGLAAGLAALGAKADVVIHEATGHAGGRCRSFIDPLLNRVIDNGTHLILGANRRTLALIGTVDAQAKFLPLLPTSFSLFDLAASAWTELKPGALRPLPGGNLALAGDIVRLLMVSPGRSVDQLLGRSRHFATLWEPLTLAILNTEAKTASASLLSRVIRKTLLAGPSACQAHLASAGLSAGLIDPALGKIAALGGKIRLNSRLTEVEGAGACNAMHFKDEIVILKPADRVILALPPWEASRFVAIPAFETRSILNLHFRLDRPALLAGGRRFAGILGGLSQWVFCRGDILSVTISAWPREEAAPHLAVEIWREVRRLLTDPQSSLPPFRMVTERRATIAHGTGVEAHRPTPLTPWKNVFLAGDYTRTGLPSTIEGAIQSGETAARLATRRH